MEHDHGRGGVGDGRDLRAGGQSMPTADPSATFLDRDVGSRSHGFTIVIVGQGGWDTTPSSGIYLT